MSDVKKKGLKPKPLKINVKDGIMEGNLIDLPFVIYEKTKEPITYVEYNWSDSAGNKRSLSVRGSVLYGVPGEFEYDVLVALFRMLVKEQEIVYNQEIKEDSEIPFENLKVHFTLNELLKEMGYSSSGSSCERVQQAIETLRETVIYGSIYDRGNEEYLTESVRSFNIISQYQTMKRTLLNGDDKAVQKKWDMVKANTFVVIDPFFVRSLCNTYFNFFDYNGYLSIGRAGIAKKMYLLFSKWRGDKNVLEAKYQTLYDRIPISKETPNNRKKEKIKRGCERLKAKGLIKDYSMEKDRVIIQYVSDEALEIENQKKLTKYVNLKQVKARLKEIGYSEEEIDDRENIIGELLPDIKALLRYVDDQIQKVEIKNQKSYVESFFKKPFDIPKEYYLKTGF